MDGKQVSNTKKYKITEKGPKRQMSIKDAQLKDAGIVTAAVSDRNSSAELHVEGCKHVVIRPTILEAPIYLEFFHPLKVVSH